MTTGPKHVVVVGAGIIGASIAWNLARRGARVTIVAEEAEGRATPNSFAWINASWGNPEPYFRLRMRSIAEWKALADAVPGVEPEWSGGLCWDLPDDDLAAYRAEHEAWGYRIRWVEADEIARLEPYLADAPQRALHAADEGAVEPTVAARALLDAATAQGARLVATTATHLEEAAGGTLALVTRNGRIEADAIVLAAGAGTPALAATLNVSVPIEVPPGLLVHSRPLATRVLNGLVIAPEAHIRQTADGRIVAGSDFGGTDPGADPDRTAGAILAAVKRMLPNVDDLTLDFHSTGYRPTPIDGFPIVGQPKATPGLYLAVMHSGVTLAPAIGLFAATEILDGTREPLLAPYRPDRFA